jgi:hypothetical protein
MSGSMRRLQVPINSLVRALARIYLSARRIRTGKAIPHKRFMQSKGVETCFKKLVKKLERIQADAGIDIDPFNYIKAHFEFFGEKTYPQHLISKCSYTIYTLWQSQRQKGKTVEPCTYEEQAELLTYLMECRKCTAEEVIEQVGFLFTNDFRIRCGKRKKR